MAVLAETVGYGTVTGSSGGTVYVTTSAELRAALADAAPGDEIVLANGIYTGSFVASANGTSSDPITVRALNPNKAIFSGGLLEITGDSWVVKRAVFDNNAGIELNNADNCRVVRNMFTDGTSRAGVAIHDNADGNSISRNEFSNSHHGVKMWFARDATDGEQSQNNVIWHNWFHDFSDPDVDGLAVQIGWNTAASNNNTGTRILYNRIENIASSDTVAQVKAGGVTVVGNTFLGMGEGVVGNRHGTDNTWRKNWFENFDRFSVLGEDHLIEGNRLINCDLALFSGDITQSNIEDDTHPALMNSTIARNIVSGSALCGEARIALGYDHTCSNSNSSFTVDATGNTLAANQGKLTRYTGKELGNTVTSTYKSVDPAVKLTSSDVGMNYDPRKENLEGSRVEHTLTDDSSINTLDGKAGNEVLRSGLGDDTLIGSSGRDTADYSATTSRVVVRLAGQTASGSEIGSDKLLQIETASGGSAADVLRGSAGANTLIGNKGSDELTGRGEIDVLTGGLGTRDDFIYLKKSDSTGAGDLITDFEVSLDKIDVSALSEQLFTFSEQRETFNTATAPELRYVKDTANNLTHIYGDVNGDNETDLHIREIGLLNHISADFIL